MKRNAVVVVRRTAIAALLLGMSFIPTAGPRAETAPGNRPAAPRGPVPNAMHPLFAPLDSTGAPVARSGLPASSSRTCGACHDVEAIRAHDDHWTASVRVDCVACHFEGGRLPADPAAYDAGGRLRREAMFLSGPRDAQCGACHGIAHAGRTPLEIPADFGLAPDPPRTYALTLHTGEILSGQDLSESFLNLPGKEARAYPWDVHLRRLVTCVDCHYAANNPLKNGRQRVRPSFLAQDPRRIEFAEYLKRPDHRLAAAECRSCHDPLAAHDFLPYKERHLDALECGACHVPGLFGPAARLVDSTVVTLQGAPALVLRGFDADPGRTLNTAYDAGYVPLLRPVAGADGRTRLAPVNAVATYAWTDAATGAPVPWDRVTAAFLVDGRYAPPIQAVLDADGDGAVSAAELRLDTPAKLEAVRARLRAVGVADPRPAAAVGTYPVRHGVQAGAQVMRDCNSCHTRGGRLASGLALGPYAPAGLIVETEAVPPEFPGRDVFGHARGGWADRMGFLLFLLVVAGVGVHTGVRFLTRSTRPRPAEELERVYLYTTYERFWHWLMAGSVLVLALTGLQVHFAGVRGALPLPQAVVLHNAFALILTANAFLALFYHVTTRAIQRFFPPREGIRARVLEQARFYTSGIFLGRPHPSPKTPERRLNPLQQVTYLLLLNVLFPLQVVTGAFIWGVSRRPDLADRVGGLTLMAPLHSLGAWLFLAFMVLHLYLTTTGHTVTSNLKAMVDGYDEVEPDLLSHKEGSRA